MADKFKPRFSVSVTPVVELGETDNKYAAHSVLHEEIRSSVGGSGTIDTIEDDDLDVVGYEGGTPSYVTSNASTAAIDANTELVYIKHTGHLFSSASVLGVKCADADTVDIKVAGPITIANLKAGEAMVLPRPVIAGNITLGSGSGHVAVQVVTMGS
jgi:hypothetical protein